MGCKRRKAKQKGVKDGSGERGAPADSGLWEVRGPLAGGTVLTGPPGASQGGRPSQDPRGCLRGDGPHRTTRGVSGGTVLTGPPGVSRGTVLTGPPGESQGGWSSQDPGGGGCQSGEPQSWRGIRASAGSVDTSFQDLLSRGVEKWSVRDGGEADEVGGGEMVSEGRRWGRRGFLLR